MFGTIRKHQTWLWAIIITITIISFVVFFSPYTKMDSGGGTVRLGSINGKNVSQEQYIAARKDVMLQYFFMSGGRWPEGDMRQTGFDIERELYQWLLLLQKADQMGIHFSSDTVASVARDMIGQFQRAGISSPQMFFTQILQPKGLAPADFEHFVRNYLTVQQLIATLGMSGKLVPPQELDALYKRERQELQTEVVLFSATNYLSSVSVTPEAVAQFYSNRLSQFRLPERVTVKYVEFNISNWLAQAEAELTKTNLSEIVDANVERLGTNYTRYGKTPEEAKTKIRQEIIRSRALQEARRKAAEFASRLYDIEPRLPQNLDLAAASNGLTVKVTAPFDRQDVPAGLDVSEQFTTAAFSLSPTNEPFAGPVVGENGAYILAYNQRIPSELPRLDAIRPKVETEFRRFQAASLARQAGIDAHRKITNAIAQGKTFEAACAEANVKPISLPPFSLSTRSLPDLDPRISLNDVKQLAFSLEPGHVSTMQFMSDGGMIVYAKSRLPVDENKMKTDMPAFANYVRQSRVNEAFNEWFRKEFQTAFRDTPLNAPKTPPTMGPSGAAKAK